MVAQFVLKKFGEGIVEIVKVLFNLMENLHIIGKTLSNLLAKFSFTSLHRLLYLFYTQDLTT